MADAPSRRERSKADKMRRILDASEKLFARNGFDGTTVQQIADDADVAVGTLFLYVSDKSEILLRLFHNAIDAELNKAVKQLKAGKKFIPSVSRFLLDLMAPYEKNGELSRIFWREFLFHKGQVRTELDLLTKTMLQVLQEKIIDAQAVGEVDASVDPAVGALQIYSVFHSVLAFHLAECLPGSAPHEVLEPLLQSMWWGMAPRDR